MKNEPAPSKQHFGAALHNESQLRDAVKSGFLARCANDPGTRIIDELGLRHGLARIDIAVVNGIIHGIELKSDSDNLKRLPHQIQVYNSVLDRVTLVVGPRHACEATKLVPVWWGIKIATIGYHGGIEFESFRKPDANPCLDPVSICRLLWRQEALNLLQEFGEAACVRHKARAAIYARLAEVVDLLSIQQRVRHQLKSRTDWRSDLRQG
jgi:hypothetical protein